MNEHPTTMNTNAQHTPEIISSQFGDLARIAANARLCGRTVEQQMDAMIQTARAWKVVAVAARAAGDRLRVGISLPRALTSAREVARIRAAIAKVKGGAS